MAGLLATSGLTRRFGGLVAVDSVDLDIERGSVHGLIGPNGAGKTTVLNLVSGHLAATAGTIMFNGRNIAKLPPERRAVSGIRRTFQNLKLFREMSAVENVMIGLHAATRSEIFHSLLHTRFQKLEEKSILRGAREALDFVGLIDFADQIAGSLPYGYQKLLEIARAFVAKPALLLLDEPAAGLNGTESKRLIDLIRRIRATGVTIMLVEHQMDVVMPTCDHITVLNYGRRLAGGTPTEIRQHPDVIKAYLGKRADLSRPQLRMTSETTHAAP